MKSEKPVRQKTNKAAKTGKKDKHREKGEEAEVTAPSPYRAMWLLAMFDLPVTTIANKKAYTKFRKGLLKAGFLQLQFSVYGRYCVSEDASEVYMKQLMMALPASGEVRVIKITDHQFGKMRIFEGKKETQKVEAVEQLELF